MYNQITYTTVPQRHGQDKRGVDKGPEYLEKYGIATLFQTHSQNPIIKKEITKPADVERTRGELGLKDINQVNQVNYQLRDVIAEIYSPNKMLFNLGGDHSMGLGTIAGVKKANPNSKIGVIWFDAHPDINTPESSPSGNIHGIPLACCCGIGPEFLTNTMDKFISTQDIVYVGIRSIDDGEAELIKKDNITHFKSEDVKKVGMDKVIETIKEKFKDYDYVHLSFDIDGIDPSEIIGTGTAVPDGVSLEDACYFLKRLREIEKLHSFDLVEYNPEIEEVKTVENIFKCLKAFFLEE